MDILIQARGLTKAFGSHGAPTLAVDCLNLQVRAGEVYGLVGPDGAGKTTTIRLLCGALKATQGEAFIGTHRMDREPERGRELIGYLPQRFSLYEELTVLENLRFFAEVRGISSHDWLPRSREILDFVGLGAFTTRRAAQLSGGMKQKLGLAAALIHRPRILLLDEPTSGVDPVTRQDFWQLIIRLVAEEGVTVLISTPYMDEAARCSRLGFMRQGQILQEGTPEVLRASLQGRVLELRGHPLAPLRLAAAADPQVEDVRTFGDRLHLRITSKAAGQPAAIKGLAFRLYRASQQACGTIDSLKLVNPQLEDVFMALLDGQKHAAEPKSEGVSGSRG